MKKFIRAFLTIALIFVSPKEEPNKENILL